MKSSPTDGPGNDRAIEMKLTRTYFLTRWPCHICGGYTEKDAVLCEGDLRGGPLEDYTPEEHQQWRESAEQADREWAEQFERKQADEDRSETLMREAMLLNRPEGLVQPPLDAWLDFSEEPPL